MGIIKRQGIKQSVVSYAGMVLGVLSTLLIYTHSTEAYGLFRLLYDAAYLVSPFILLGFHSVTVRFFPTFKDPGNGHNGFLFFLLSVAAFGFIIFIAALPAIRWLLLEQLFKGRSDLFQTHFNYIVPLAFLIVYIKVFVQYISNFQRIVVPAIFEQLLIKITLPLLILLYIYQWITIEGMVNGVVLSYLVALIGLVTYTWWLGELNLRPNLKFIKRPLAKEISVYASYGILAMLSGQLAFKIDTLMVGGLIDVRHAGIYTIAATLTEVIIKPSRAIFGIAGPIIAKSWEENDMEEIKMIYQKSSLNLLIVGIFIFLGVWLSIEALFSLMPNTEELLVGKYVILFLGMARLVDMATSVNNEILNYSKYFRFSLYAMLLLAVFNIICNLIFIPKFHLVGAAMATLLSGFLFNLVKLLFIKWKFEIQPFSRATLKTLGVALVAYAMAYIIPSLPHPLLDILVRSSVFAVIYGTLILKLNISPDINDLVQQGMTRVNKFFK